MLSINTVATNVKKYAVPSCDQRLDLRQMCLHFKKAKQERFWKKRVLTTHVLTTNVNALFANEQLYNDKCVYALFFAVILFRWRPRQKEKKLNFSLTPFCICCKWRKINKSFVTNVQTTYDKFSYGGSLKSNL